MMLAYCQVWTDCVGVATTILVKYMCSRSIYAPHVISIDFGTVVVCLTWPTEFAQLGPASGENIVRQLATSGRSLGPPSYLTYPKHVTHKRTGSLPVLTTRRVHYGPRVPRERGQWQFPHVRVIANHAPSHTMLR
ncbi:hypothetical protein PC118_g18300 [Phytophthora cactorum]|uniref:Uncharacterized protein n=1 Tax=Phytophthora cactorum TaxID=29920 RepID=A0A8T1F5D6_9STRA|nr:hypothetical protein PC118_g18300 [Phytophthora cactorum]KAG3065270.1 hypothetical protein PC122_g18192 [Phytophthora cactorum]